LRLATALALAVCGLLPHPAEAEGPNRAALLVVHGDGRTVGQCIAFEEAEISSHEVLQRSGLAVRFSGYGSLGAAVCAIEGEGCPREDQQCFCQCLGTRCLFWTFWLWRDGQWAYSQRGASNVPVHDGDVQAWFWSDGQTAPPEVTFGGVCPPPPTETPQPTDTPLPTPVPTNTPVPTPAPTATPPPTAAPTDTALPTVAPTDALLPTAAPTDTALPIVMPTDTVVPTRAPSPTPTATATLQQPSPTVATASPPIVAQTLTRAPTASPPLPPTPPAVPAPPPSGNNTPAAQYVSFAVLAAALLGGFWLLRRRQGAS